MATMTRDRKTGKMRKVDPAKSLSAKRAAAKRGHRPLSTSTKLAITRGVNKALKTGKTAAGRKVIKHASTTSSTRVTRPGRPMAAATTSSHRTARNGR